MDPEVTEISPPKVLKRKEVAYHEIIDVDMDEDCNDVVLIQGNKKKVKGISLGPSDAEQGSMHSAQTRKQVGSNNKGKDVSMMGGVQMGQSFIDLDDYDFEDDDYDFLQLQSQFDNKDIPTTGIKADKFQMKKNSSTLHANNSSKKNSSLTGSCSSMGKVVDNEDVLIRYESFKKFDIVVDYSDHYYATNDLRFDRDLLLLSLQKAKADKKLRGGRQLATGARQWHASSVAPPPKNWAKKIQNEWRILEENLPDTIFVRAYESRMDLLRAVIIGAEGTPYHDGLFFFDVCFPSTYPDIPPLVRYHHRSDPHINMNIHCDGKVCLSLLNTWGGTPEERWRPGTSTMLQVLVSIQGLVLNAKPYYNLGPGYQSRMKSDIPCSSKISIPYNESKLIASLATMVSTMKKPPKNFEDFVIGHFRKRARDILMACKAYTEGVQVGCVVRGGVQDLDLDEEEEEEEEEEANNNSWSDLSKANLVAYLNPLVAAFKQIGAKVADEFIYLVK